MNQDKDTDYFLKRAVEERIKAGCAGTREAAICHAALAETYEVKARQRGHEVTRE